ncbi:hypothetical protein [Thermogemmatispora carboxidivorans]|uniref:hypothetical protein n=1 Tax=Thermogemmatispora carboxidivorans TaxID=1382306 RepID=UPI00138E428E|nr:hypothetical protein [Thermogemmatispora carboxidivorans]
MGRRSLLSGLQMAPGQRLAVESERASQRARRVHHCWIGTVIEVSRWLISADLAALCSRQRTT